MKILFVAKIGKCIHPDAFCVKRNQIAYIIVEIKESENKHSILGDDTGEREYEDVGDSDSTWNLRKLNIVVL